MSAVFACDDCFVSPVKRLKFVSHLDNCTLRKWKKQMLPSEKFCAILVRAIVNVVFGELATVRQFHLKNSLQTGFFQE